MDRKSTQQEILLVTGTSYTTGQWEKREGADKSDPLTEKQLLEEACWNGAIREMLPEIWGKEGDPLYLWRVREGNSFLELDLGDSPVTVEVETSIDPYAFLPVQLYN